MTLLFSCQISWAQSADSANAVGRTHSVADSLLWKTPEVAGFLVKVLGDSSTVNYPGFALEKAGHIATDKANVHKRNSPPTEAGWVFSPNRRLAAWIVQGFDPDKDLWLYNQAEQGRTARIDNCGTSCDYRGVFWIDDQRLVFALIDSDYPKVSDTLADQREDIPIVKLFNFASDSAFSYRSSPMKRVGRSPVERRSECESPCHAVPSRVP